MRRLNAGTIARAYLVIVLLLAVVVSPPFQLGLSLVLLVIQLYCAYRPPKASLNLILVVASLVLAPLAVEALVGAAFAVLLGRDGRKLFFASSQYIAIALLEHRVFAAAKLFPFAFGDSGTALLQKPFHIGSPGIALGFDDEGQLSQ